MSKLDKRAISILVIAILVLSFVLPLVSVSAGVGDVTFAKSGTATYTWSEAQKHTGSYSVKLTAEGSNFAAVVITPPTGITLGDLSTITCDWSWWYYIATGQFGGRGTSLELHFQSATDPDGYAEMTIMDKAYGTPAHGGPPTLDAWTEQIVTSTTTGIIFGVQEDGTVINQYPIPATGEGTIADLVAHMINEDANAGAWELEEVRVVLGWISGPTTAYVDDVTICGVTCPLETALPPTGDFSIDSVSAYIVDYDDTLTVTGSGVTAGSEVKIFWDYASGTYAHLLNTTEGNPDGTFDCNVDVPSDIGGAHYLWATDVSTGETISSAPLTMVPRVKLSPSSGLKGDDVDVKGYGFGEEKVIGIQIDTWIRTLEAVGVGDGVRKEFSLDYVPVVATTESIFLNGTPQAPATYAFVPATGVITFVTAPVSNMYVTATYNRDVVIIEASSTFETDDLGYFVKTFDVPDFPYGTYDITVTEVAGPTVTKTFTLGASISVSPDEGPTGAKVTVEGRGWTVGNTITFREKTSYRAIQVVDLEVITVGSGGTFSADVIIPVLGTEGDYDIEAVEAGTAPKAPSSDGFELTGLPKVVVSPTYGTPGASITVTGSNFTQIAGTDVTVTINTPTTMELVIAETKSDGTFEDTFMSPAIEFKAYTVTAEDEYFIDADDAFKVGLIALIINPTYGEAGTKISITGIGFLQSSSYNVTFGTKLYEDYGTVSGAEAISDFFYVPNVELGTYDMTIIDEDENELTVQFEVTAVTEVDLDPAMAPSTYNVTIEGYNFADKEYEEVYFVLYNSTNEWDLDVWQNAAGNDPVETGKDGNFTAWWEVLPEADLSLGDYTINVTSYDDFLIQVPFSVVEARVDVAPRKLEFDRGDTIQFNVKNDFDFKDSYMKIWDPYDNLYWKTETFSAWLKVGDLYTVPYYLQTSGMNPMTLAQDAPLGPWFYVFYEEGTTQLTNGTFNVGPSASAQVDQKLTEIWGSLDSLTQNIDSITDELAGDISDLSGDIDDVVADVQDMIDDITADLAQELAGVAEDTEAAVGELEDAIGDIASAQNALQSDIDDMGQDTAAAKDAAEDAKTTSQGLTTLVYGAIGASLIAALAAIVSLMQISKKIA